MLTKVKPLAEALLTAGLTPPNPSPRPCSAGGGPQVGWAARRVAEGQWTVMGARKTTGRFRNAGVTEKGNGRSQGLDSEVPLKYVSLLYTVLLCGISPTDSWNPARGVPLLGLCKWFPTESLSLARGRHGER